ncbi:MAG: RQC domain-containing protein, partial [Candidatus Thiodiazotropha sp.]
STYGIGDELNASEWRTLFRQLIARGLLSVDLEGYGGLRLTEASRPVLKGEISLMLRKARTRTPRKRQSRSTPVADANVDEKLWEALRSLRRDLKACSNWQIYREWVNVNLRLMARRFSTVFAAIHQKHSPLYNPPSNPCRVNRLTVRYKENQSLIIFFCFLSLNKRCR